MTGEIMEAARMVIAGWRVGRIAAVDEGEDKPEGDMALGALAEALRAHDAAGRIDREPQP